MKRYGLILADNGSAWYISGAPDERWTTTHWSESCPGPRLRFRSGGRVVADGRSDSGRVRFGGYLWYLRSSFATGNPCHAQLSTYVMLSEAKHLSSEAKHLSGEARHLGPIYVGLALLSSAALAFEITLTRLFSVTQWYHFAFLAVSVALLGYGAAARRSAWRLAGPCPRRRRRRRWPSSFPSAWWGPTSA